jgi:hypothetical protein
MTKELCIRCNKPTPYHPNTPITLRRYYVEGSGQLCSHCFYELYPMPTSFGSKLSVEERPTEQGENIPNKE